MLPNTQSLYRPEACRQGVCVTRINQSTGHIGSMDTLPNTSTERHLGKHRAWPTEYHGGHTHAKTNVTGQKHIEQVHR